MNYKVSDRDKDRKRIVFEDGETIVTVEKKEGVFTNVLGIDWPKLALGTKVIIHASTEHDVGEDVFRDK